MGMGFSENRMEWWPWMPNPGLDLDNIFYIPWPWVEKMWKGNTPNLKRRHGAASNELLSWSRSWDNPSGVASTLQRLITQVSKWSQTLCNTYFSVCWGRHVTYGHITPGNIIKSKSKWNSIFHCKIIHEIWPVYDPCRVSR